jgi:hypothetical protein
MVSVRYTIRRPFSGPYEMVHMVKPWEASMEGETWVLSLHAVRLLSMMTNNSVVERDAPQPVPLAATSHSSDVATHPVSQLIRCHNMGQHVRVLRSTLMA